ncbi:hypothetical protein [[Flexibacter] sp. ATCC 35208]|uniref:hypothetical protein n=1 Tax=[Flexibacter] sp. ATCC 35208 TaxID=1936242 RepID=UPI0009C44EF0|nr:hypothetical protein [[Flexibacter] sp. ATCC 35208]OMP74582.1 hypothetical protein BW716_34565 [[Flexibacter] sp. ATCC 35208]
MNNRRLLRNAEAAKKAAAKTQKAFKKLDNVGKTAKGSAAKTVANKAQDAAKTEKEDKKGDDLPVKLNNNVLN